MALTSFNSPVSSQSYPIIVHSHLRWNGVWQRPQHLMSRLSKLHRVLFVEGPILHDEDIEPCFDLRPAPEFPGVTILQMHFPASRFNDSHWVDMERRRLLDQAVHSLRGKFDHPVQWFYDPQAVEAHLGQHKAVATVYDCMNESAGTRLTYLETDLGEDRLTSSADLVFANKASLRQQHPNTQLPNSGVDIAHFGKARLNSCVIPSDMRSFEGPVLGYFGIINEQVDFELIEKLATTQPDWHIVMIGPVVNVSPEELPQADNIHWMGQRDYNVLPNYAKAFDVALMPLKVNGTDEVACPCEALEYMASATPIVATALSEVVTDFGTIVKVAKDADEFVKLCLAHTKQIDQVAVVRGLKMAYEHTWDNIVSETERHIDETIARKAVMISAPIHDHLTISVV